MFTYLLKGMVPSGLYSKTHFRQNPLCNVTQRFVREMLDESYSDRDICETTMSESTLNTAVCPETTLPE